MKRDAGDFQTPPGLVRAVLDRLGPRWPRVLEPTCGRGHFLESLLEREPIPRELIGIELQHQHFQSASALAERLPASSRLVLKQGSLFDFDLTRDLDWHERGPLLVVGNPPWVTNSELGTLRSGNLPKKTNVKHDRGLDAMTGASNFDIAEAIWVKLLNELAGEDATIALLCKTSVARRVLEHAHRSRLPVSAVELVQIDARGWFGVSVEACLLVVSLEAKTLTHIPVFDRLVATEPIGTMGFIHDRLVSDLGTYAPFAFADGACSLTWRQGLKHDAAGVMELSRDAAGTLRNAREEAVDIESDHVFPLLKGTDLAGAGPVVSRRSVIVTQRKVGQDTAWLEHQSPRLWRYLEANGAVFDQRKSSIYRSAPRFAMFGIGPYSFEPFKVAVSGLHRDPRFHALGPVNGRPLMLDDTCYGLACETAEQAALVSVLLNRPESIGLLRALTFPGAKRPVTKATLQRIDLAALLRSADRGMIRDQAMNEVERLTRHTSDVCEPLESLLEPCAAPVVP